MATKRAKIIALLSTSLLVALVTACDGSRSVEPPENPCVVANHCLVVGDDIRCENGYEWEDRSDRDNFICVPIAGGGDGDGAPPDGGVGDGDGTPLDGGFNGDGDGDGDGLIPPAGTTVFDGDILIEDPSELDALVALGYGEITGQLRVRDVFGAQDIELPSIHTVGGRIRVDGNVNLTRFAMPNLISVGDEILIEQNELLKTVELRSLLNASVEVDDADGLETFLAPELRQADIDLLNTALVSLDLSSLHDGSVRILSSQLEVLTLPNFVNGSVFVKSGVLGAVAMPLQETGSFGVWGNLTSPLTSLSMPKIAVLTGFEVRGFPALTSISAPALMTVSSVFWIAENPVLPSCDALALLVQVLPSEQPQEYSFIRDNAPGCESAMATCSVGCASRSVDSSCGCDPGIDWAGTNTPACSDQVSICEEGNAALFPPL